MDKKPPTDPNVAAFQAVQRVAGQMPLLAVPESPPQKNIHAQALAALGASKGGKARAASLSARKRSEIAKKAALARWSKKGG